MNKKKERKVLIIIVLLLVLTISMLPGCAGATEKEKEHLTTDVLINEPGMNQNEEFDAAAEIKVSFKIDPRFTRGMYMGDRWTSPQMYHRAGIQNTKETTVETRATVHNAKGKRLNDIPEWISEDPMIVTVSPSQGKEVNITVKRVGQSKVSITSGSIAKILTVKGLDKNGILQVEITQ